MHQNVGFEERFGRGTHSRNGNDPNAGKMNAAVLILVCLKNLYSHIQLSNFSLFYSTS